MAVRLCAPSTSEKREFGKVFCAFVIGCTALFLSTSHTIGAEAGKIVIKSPIMLNKRLMSELLKPFKAQNPNLNVQVDRGRRVERVWSVATNQLAGGRSDVLLTSRLDWKHRADAADKENLRYVPMAKQLVHRIGKVVGGVEYGALVPRKNPSREAEAFLRYIQSETAQNILKQSDSYHFVPLETQLKDFEPPEWYNPAPWETPKPEMWHGLCHVGQKFYHTIVLAEIKKLWMQGYNEVQGMFIRTEPIFEFCRKRGIRVATVPALLTQRDPDWKEKRKQKPENPVAHYIKRVRKSLQYPSIGGTYFHNEDHLGRNLARRLLKAQHHINTDTEDKLNKKRIQEYKVLNKQFPEWLRAEHGSLKKLNQRWDTSYNSWDEIDIPEPPLAWIKNTALASEAGLSLGGGYGGDHTDRLIGRLFHDAIRFNALSKFPKILDYWRFTRQVWSRKYKALAGKHFIEKDFENHAQKLRPIQEKGFLWGTKSRPNPYVFREVREFNTATYDHPGCKVPPYFSQVPVDTLQTALGWPVWNSEHHLYNHGASTPQRVRYHLLQTYLMGQFKSSSYNRWRTSAAKRRPRQKAAIRARTQIRRNEEVFRAFLRARADADIAVLINEGNRGYNTLPEEAERPEFGGSVKAYGYVGALGRQWKYVLNRDISPEHCTDTLIIDAPWLQAETVKKINNLPADRQVIVVDSIPDKNEYGESLPRGLLRKLRQRAEVIKKWEKLQEVIKPAQKLSGPYTEVWKAGFFWWSPFVAGGRYSYTMPVPKLEVRKVQHEGNLYVSVTNHSIDREVTAAIPYAAGNTVRELTSETSEPYTYGPSETTTFPTQSVNIYEIKNGR